MPSDSGENHCRTTATKGGGGVGAPPSEPQHLPCPRCDSTNTKFCYYNNYNFSQPRHFCKACRRYWTHGGTLRDIPVGGGSRKNAKRSRLSTTTHNTVNTSSGSVVSSASAPAPAVAHSVMIPFAADHGGALQFLGDGKPGGGFMSLLSNSHGPGVFGLGVGGFEDVNFGVGRGVWPFSGAGEVGFVGGTAAGGGGSAWQVEGGDGGGFIGGGDCFALPDLAISTLGNSMK